MIEKIEQETNDFNFSVVNLAPTLNRPVNVSEKHKMFLDITNLPPKQENHRGVFATNMIMYHQSIYDDVLQIEDPQKISYYAIDDFIYQFITSVKESYVPILPIGPQISDWSDVSGGIYNNFYTQTYNWNQYSSYKIPNEFLDLNQNKIIKENKEHKQFNYVS